MVGDERFAFRSREVLGPGPGRGRTDRGGANGPRGSVGDGGGRSCRVAVPERAEVKEQIVLHLAVLLQLADDGLRTYDTMMRFVDQESNRLERRFFEFASGCGFLLCFRNPQEDEAGNVV